MPSRPPSVPLWLKFGVTALGVVVFYGFMMTGDRRLTQSSAQESVERKTPGQRLRIDVLERALGSKTPTGRGVVFGHVEGGAGNYAPRHDAKHFDGIDIRLESGVSKVNGHANATARVIYGQNGLAPGVRRVHCYTSHDWLTKGYLRTDSALQSVDNDIRIFTHSWIGQDAQSAPLVLRRIDYLVDEREVLFFVGVNNGAKSKVPPLLGSAHNVIAVGAWDGSSSGGYTQVEGEGRCKPDIVAPHHLTSFSTPMVAAVAARLLEVADNHAQSSSAKHSEVIKAVLMAGAHKPKNWKQAEDKPLDEHLGAGRCRAEQSYWILSQPEASPDGKAGTAGWDFGQLDKGKRATYEIDVPSDGLPVSVVVVWHRRILGRTVRGANNKPAVWHNGQRTADFDLRVAHHDGDDVSIVGRSTGDVDNVEHVWLPGAKAGKHTIHITRKDTSDERWDYAVAWRVGEWTP